ncbi:response regulator [Candidatus Ferrigenium straubiae]|jgi:chemosensory pili system protein ChpA (sensor histidine kinase/response regulator)|uniref:response regulator n=1 Tax=Candidatus Ferrigenium straubiae TaxID=2919506 RepID=UPI003F4AB4E9
MADATQPGRDTLDNALSGIGAPLEQYLAAPDNVAALDAARGGLHRLLDALRDARLYGTAAFCTELKTVLDELSSQPGMFSDLHRGVLQQALAGLAHHLDALANGADDAALRLFPEYQALQQLRGLEVSFELDLFHPNLDVQLPQRILDMPPEDDAPQRLRALRSRYQQGLLHWLRKDAAPVALQAMQEALEGAMRCMPPDGSRAFWWVAGGLLECLRLDGMPAWPNTSHLLGRIDQQMRAAAEGHAGEAQTILNEMLYLIGSSSAASDPAEEIRQAYALEFYLPLPAALPPNEAAQILAAMRDRLQAAEKSLEWCVQGNRMACEKFAQHAGQLAAQADRLGRNALQYLAQQACALAQQAGEPENLRLIALDMAMALLLLGSGIRHYGKLNSGFLKEARILSERMQAALTQQPEDAQQLAELVHLHCLQQQGDVKIHLFNEMLANLQYVEQGLRAFFTDPAKRNELGELLRLCGQIRGGLHIVSLEQAEQLLVAIQGCIRRFAQSDDVPEPADDHALSGAINALQKYLRHLARGEAGDASSLQTAWGWMVKLRQPPAAAAVAPEPRGIEMPYPAGEDQELLEVFLEEAQEVLHTLRNNLEACRLHLSREFLVNIRRGFHTLKGSGRMVGLTDLGEVAWNVERALNKWLQDNRPPTPGLLDFIAGAERRFTGWVDALNSQGGVSVEAGDLAATAQQIENGIEPGEAAEQPPGGEPVATPEKEAVPPSAPVDKAATLIPLQSSPAMPVAAGKPQARDDIDAQMLPVFLEEADELCPQIGAGLRAWRDQPGDERQPQLLLQLLHTLKGSARMAGAMRTGGIAHEMEEQVLSAARAAAQPELLDVLESGLDHIASQIEKLRGGAAGAEPRVAEYTGVERRREQRVPEGGGMLRVHADLVKRLASEAGEISMARSRIETEMRAFKEGLLELTGSVVRLRKQLREIEMQAESRMQARASLTPGSAERFDPLEFDRFTRLQELTRFMNESVHDVQTVQQSLLKNFEVTAAALAAQGRQSRELQQNLMNVRMVSFASIAERLYRVVRQAAKELNKRANLELLGTELELDRSMLERMTASFEHLLRNALAHGIESEAVRVQRGKNPIGEIRLGLRHAGNELVFEFSDDGAGLDLVALREKALAKGLLRPDEAAGDGRLAQLVFISGISTATEVTEVAGRGIGLDVVHSEIAALGGRIEVSSQQGLGTRFTIHLPLTLAVTHVLLVRSGKETYAIPSNMVEQARQVKPAELAQFYRDRQVEWQGHLYPLHYLPHLLGDSGCEPEEQRHNPLVLLHSGEQRIALHVDGLLGNQEAVVKNTGPQLAQLPVIAGATVLGSGAVALILNPAQLAQRVAAPVKAAPEEPPAQPLVMVVDDSLTVRKVTTRLLMRAGYRVATAKDGMDALEQLGGTLPAVMLLDIEMPRMDGFELTKHLRRDARTQHLPIIMITSRAADKHRDYALQLGANAYLGKPYQEDELLKEIVSFAALP